MNLTFSFLSRNMRLKRRQIKWIIWASVSALRERCRWMEGGLKESEECELALTVVLLHSAHPPCSSLSVSLQPQPQTATPTLPSLKPTLAQRANQPKKGNSLAHVLSSVGLCVVPVCRSPTYLNDACPPPFCCVPHSLQGGALLLKIRPFTSPKA